MWPITKFWCSNHITGTAEPKIVKFCTQVGYINSINIVTYHQQKGRGYGHMTVLKFRRLSWCSATRGFVSDSWATCWHIMRKNRQTNKQTPQTNAAGWPTRANAVGMGNETNTVMKRKWRVFILRHLYTMYISKGSGMDHTVLPANTPCLPFLRKRSPDGATPNWGKRHPIAYYSSIDPEGMKGWVGTGLCKLCQRPRPLVAIARLSVLCTIGHSHSDSWPPVIRRPVFRRSQRVRVNRRLAGSATAELLVKYPRYRRPMSWKIEKSPYLDRGSNGFDEIWHSDAVPPSWPYQPLKMSNF